MIHVTCDRCAKLIGQDERRHVVRIHISPAFDPNEISDDDLDVDHLKEVGDLIKSIEQNPDAAGIATTPHAMRCDLCEECLEAFVQHPVGTEATSGKKAFYSPN